MPSQQEYTSWTGQFTWRVAASKTDRCLRLVSLAAYTFPAEAMAEAGEVEAVEAFEGGDAIIDHPGERPVYMVFVILSSRHDFQDWGRSR
jgi:hypothetical protein